ncbi:MAG: hypothetical protein AABW88_01455 [Nanoarchaeota archaeon]
MHHYEIIFRKKNSYSYLVKRNGEIIFEADKFVHAGLCVSIGIIKAYDSRRKVDIVYRGKISKKDKFKLDGILDELWGKKEVT